MVYGENMLKAVVPGSARSFNYQEEFNLTDEEVRQKTKYMELSTKILGFIDQFYSTIVVLIKELHKKFFFIF